MVPRPTHCNIPHAASSITSIHTYYRARIDSDMPYQHPIFYPSLYPPQFWLVSCSDVQLDHFTRVTRI